MTLGRFPRRTLQADRSIYRIHRAARSEWWFSDDGSGRFDPIGSGKGACYFAERPLGAWVEVFRRQMLWSEAAVADRALQTVALGRSLRLADLTSRRALQFGVTASLGADTYYADSQAFAARAATAGFEGIRYLVRHDPRQQLYGLALFGKPGAASPANADWPVGISVPIPAEIVDEAAAAFGYRVVPLP